MLLLPRIESSFSFRRCKVFLFGSSEEDEKDELLLNHSRSGILLALKALQLPLGTGVGMMVYNCHTVMNAIDQAGCIPVFIDVKDDLTIDLGDLSKKEDKFLVLIVTHLFGIVNDVKKIKELFPNKIIIEDCAHAYGISDVYGDFATFSIGQGKLPSIGDGGWLVVRNEKYKKQVLLEYENLSDYSWLQSMILLLKLVARSWMNHRLVYSWLTMPLKKHRHVESGKETIVPKKMCRGVKSIYYQERGDVPSIIERRRKNAERLKEVLLNYEDDIQLLVGTNAFMLVAKCQNPKRLQKELEAKGIDSATHFSHAVLWAKEFGYQDGDCPNVEMMVSKLLMIPTY